MLFHCTMEDCVKIKLIVLDNAVLWVDIGIIRNNNEIKTWSMIRTEDVVNSGSKVCLKEFNSGCKYWWEIKILSS